MHVGEQYVMARLPGRPGSWLKPGPALTEEERSLPLFDEGNGRFEVPCRLAEWELGVLALGSAVVPALQGLCHVLRF